MSAAIVESVLSNICNTRQETDSAHSWFKPLHDWPRAALRVLQTQTAVVRVVIADVRGSTPREPGAAMLIDVNEIMGTIGGGRLEELAIEMARTQLHPSLPSGKTQRLVLGTELAQCCGGVVELWIERYTRSDIAILTQAAQMMRRGAVSLSSTLVHGQITRQLRLERASAQRRLRYQTSNDGVITLWERLDTPLLALWLFGAGHVGQAVARLVADLPLQLTWIDSRKGLPPAPCPDNIEVMRAADPVESVANALSGTRFLIMTHDHALDFALCQAILERNDAAWIGLIGSKSKAARFRSRLRSAGVSDERIAQLTSPIGVEGIESKLPAVIAVAVVTQILQSLGHETHAKNEAEACHGNCRQCGKAQVS